MNICIYTDIYICRLGYAKRIESNGTAEKHEACKLDTLAHRRAALSLALSNAAAVSSTSRLCSGNGRRLGAGKAADQTSIQDYPFQAMQKFARCCDISIVTSSKRIWPRRSALCRLDVMKRGGGDGAPTEFPYLLLSASKAVT
jgi:hypothetical protein